MDKKNKKSEETLVENINYKLSYEVIKKGPKYLSNSIFINLIFKIFSRIGKSIKSATRKIFKFLDYVKASSERIEISNINELNINQIKFYLHRNYYEKLNTPKEIDRDKLLNDLVVFKAYKEDLELNIKNNNLFIVFITIFLNIISIFVNVGIALKNLNDETLAGIFFLIIFVLVFSLIWTNITTGKKSNSSKLKVVNYGIYMLEAIKEDNYQQSDGNDIMKEEKSELNKNDQIDSTDDGTSKTQEDIKKEKNKNIFELSSPTVKKLEDFESEDFIKYIDDNYLQYTDPEKDKLLKDLIVLKSYREKTEHEINSKDNHKNIFDRIFALLNMIVAIILAYISQTFATFMDLKSSFMKNPEANEGLIKKAMDNLESLEIMTNIIFWILIASIIIVVISYIKDFCNKKEKESKIKKLITVNNSIYKLEAIKENGYKNPLKTKK